MDNNNYFKLIISNIKQFFSEVKLRRQEKRLLRKDKLIQNVPLQNAEYEDLAPTSDIENGEEYINALFWAIKNEKVRNIALTGPYGSGKSSIIQSYLKKYPSTKALNISLATFDIDKEGNEDFEQEIELGILKQLFYKIDSDKIPQSRYRKIKKRYYKKYFGFITGLVVVVLFGIAFFLPDKVELALNTIEKSGRYYEIGKVPSYVISCLYGLLGIGIITYILKWCMSRFRVKEVNIADKATVADEKDEDSIFDKSMDELVYFFEATKYKVVFIEDLDRFDSTKIFVKLRELNTILNNYDLIKRRIVFVYAIKDDMFKNEERTKFFDFIIPVIPIINSTNSRDMLRKKLKFEKQEDGSYSDKSAIFDISASYITLISPFIEDMRVLTNICNEFIIYRNTLKKLKFKDEEMFSMMLFKSLYPREFAKLEAEKGIVKQAFEDKKEFIKLKQIDLEKKKFELEEILNCVEKDIFSTIQDVKAAFLNYLVGEQGPFNYCNIGGRNYYYHEIMNESFDMDKFKMIDSLSISSYRGNSRNISNFKNDKCAKEYLNRIRNLKNSEGTRKNEIRNKIEEYRKKIAELHSFSLKKLIDIYDSNSIFSEQVKENKLLVYLLQKGFINENYADYINYFHPNSITVDEMKFVRGIRMKDSKMEFAFQIKNVAQVCERIESYEFKQVEVLNFDIVDYLIMQKEDSEQSTELFKGLSGGEERSYAFIKEYIERGKNIGIFIKLLCNRYHAFWDKIANDDLLTDDKKFEYLALILEYAEMPDIIIQNDKCLIEIDYDAIIEEDDKYYTYEEEDECYYYENGIRHFIKKKQALKKLCKVTHSKIIQVIQELEVYFNEIEVEGANKKVLDFIFENNYYKLNIDMLRSLFENYFPDEIVYLETENYTTISKVEYIPLIERLSDIDEFKSYIEELVIEQNSNVSESISAVEDIIQRLFDTDFELCKKVLNKEQVEWKNILECCNCPKEKKKERKKIWDCIIANQQVLSSWHNVISYYNEYGLTQELVKWVDKIMNELVKEERIEQLTDDIIKEIMVNEISIDSLDKLTRAYTVEQFDLSLLEFDKEKIEILTENQYIPFSLDYINEMYQIASECIIKYIIYNKQEFIKDIANIAIEVETVVELLRSECFEKQEIISILELVLVEKINQDMANEIRKIESLLPKTYVEKAWDLLEEENRYELLLNQIENYSIQEVSKKLASLAPVYQKLSDISKKHREYLPDDDFGYNGKLLSKLKEMDYLSSVKMDEYFEEDNITHQKLRKQQFEVWVKKQE